MTSKLLSSEERKHAGTVHKDFFDRCKSAIDQQFYLEAILLEYSAMETRLHVILGLFNMPCSLCEDTEITNRIGLQTKIRCFKNCVDNNQEFFKKSKIDRVMLSKMGKWCNSRNKRIHGLYSNTEKYEELMDRNQELAEEGYNYAYLLYNEANRLKRLKKNHPEEFLSCKFECFKPYDSCKQSLTWVNDHSAK